MFSLIYGLSLKKKKKNQLINTENRFMTVRRGTAKGVKAVKRYKFPVIRYISPRNLVHNMVTIINTVLYT